MLLLWYCDIVLVGKVVFIMFGMKVLGIIWFMDFYGVKDVEVFFIICCFIWLGI